MVHFLHLCMTTEKKPYYMDLYCQRLLFTLIHGPNIPGSYVIFFTALDFTFTPWHICNWVHFCFGPAFSFFLEIFLCSPVVVYWIPADLGGRVIFWCHIFLPFHTFHGVLMARILEWFCHSLLQWTMVCQRSSLQHIHFRWLFKEWLIASLSYASPFTTTRLWSMVVV